MKRKQEDKNNTIDDKNQSKAKKFKAQLKKDKKEKLVQPHLPKSAAEVSSNWLALKQVLSKENSTKKKPSIFLKRKEWRKKRQLQNESNESEAASNKVEDEIWFDDVDPDDIERSKVHTVTKSTPAPSTSEPSTQAAVTVQDLSLGGYTGLTKKVAIDCEFVGMGRDSKRNMLARVSIVNTHCCNIYDKFVAPQEAVTDYRTAVSGVRRSDLKHAPDFKIVQKEVADILKGRVLIGHAVKNDLQVLLLDHPKKDIRDTAKYKPFHKIVQSKFPSLKKLSQEILHTKIQEGEHSSVQDAQAAMRLYILHKRQWEKQIQEKKFKRKTETKTKEDES